MYGCILSEVISLCSFLLFDLFIFFLFFIFFFYFVMFIFFFFFFFFSSRRRHTRLVSDWSSDVCSSDLTSTSCTKYGFKASSYTASGSAEAASFHTEQASAKEGKMTWSGQAAQIGRASCRERV